MLYILKEYPNLTHFSSFQFYWVSPTRPTWSPLQSLCTSWAWPSSLQEALPSPWGTQDSRSKMCPTSPVLQKCSEVVSRPSTPPFTPVKMQTNTLHLLNNLFLKNQFYFRNPGQKHRLRQSRPNETVLRIHQDRGLQLVPLRQDHSSARRHHRRRSREHRHRRCHFVASSGQKSRKSDRDLWPRRLRQGYLRVEEFLW